MIFPIVLFEGQILDGRNRYNICKEEDIEPVFHKFTGPGSATSLVIDANIKRRDLTDALRVNAVHELSELPAARGEAIEAHREGSIRGGKARVSLPEPCHL